MMRRKHGCGSLQPSEPNAMDSALSKTRISRGAHFVSVEKQSSFVISKIARRDLTILSRVIEKLPHKMILAPNKPEKGPSPCRFLTPSEKGFLSIHKPQTTFKSVGTSWRLVPRGEPPAPDFSTK